MKDSMNDYIMDIKKLFSIKRLKYKDSKTEVTESNLAKPYRSDFHIDYDRIIFSRPFRRLSKKTQVHPLAQNDHVHNRLTHSLETASVGRSLGLIAGKYLNEKYNDFEINPTDIATMVQAACLAHDIGNPPFGHAGEAVIREWFKDNRDEPYVRLYKDGQENSNNDVPEKFRLSKEQTQDLLSLDGNAQSFRIVTQLENNFFKGGMGLTFATLGTMVKYPWDSSSENNKKDKFGYFQSEKQRIDEIFNELGLVHNGNLIRHPFSYLMEAADDICYGLLDIQDAVELKIVHLEEVEDIFKGLCGSDHFNNTCCNKNFNQDQKVGKLCAKAINSLTVHAGEVFNNKFERFRDPADKIKDLISVFDDENLKDNIQKAKKFSQEKVFDEKRKVELELGAHNIIGELLKNLIKAAYSFHHVRSKDKLSFRDKRSLDLMRENMPKEGDSLYEKYQRVVDFVVGMTDNYATDLAKALHGMGN